MTRAIAFIPELKYEKILKRAIKLRSDLFLIPRTDKRATRLADDLKQKGYEIHGGCFIYYEGNLSEDGTLYELFQSYCLSLIFFYSLGRVTCRAYQEIRGNENIVITETQLFIDEYDKFNVDPDDLVTLIYKDIKKIEPVSERVFTQLVNSSFNSLSNAVEFYLLYLSEPQIRTRLLYLSICLESILLNDEGEGISYKLGLRCAHLISNPEKNIIKENIYTEVKNIYNLRSKIIHGSNYRRESEKIISKSLGKTTSELDHILILEKIVKEVFSVIFVNIDMYNDTIADKLGQKMDALMLTVPK